MRDGQQHPPVRLVGGAGGELGGGLRLRSGEPLPQGDDLGARRRALAVEGERAADPVDRALDAAQHVVGGDLRGLPGDGCRDERVAVAVAADPGADAHEGGDDGGAGAGLAGAQRVVDPAVDVRDRREQSLVEDAHHRADLVGGGRLLRAQRGGAPQGVDLLQHPALGALLLRAADAGRIVLGEQLGEAADARRHRATAGLGRVGGEDGVEAKAGQAAAGLFLADLRLQPRVRGGDGVGGVFPARLPGALAQHTHALVLLGEVHEVEVAGEGACDLVSALDGEGLGDRRRTLEGLGGLVLERLDRGEPQALDVFEEAVGAGLAEHLTEQGAEHPDIGAHGLGDALARLEASDDTDRLGVRGLGETGVRGRGKRSVRGSHSESSPTAARRWNS